MLVLTREADQTITIGDHIEIKILEFRNSKSVRIGITAPDDMDIARGELGKFKRNGSFLGSPGDSVMDDGVAR